MTVDWTKKPSHSHYYYALSTENVGHRHVVDGFTFNVNGSNDDEHVHHYTGLTKFEARHYHRYYGVTGPAIPTEDGGHYHEIEGRVYNNYIDPLTIKFGGVVYSQTKRDVHDHNYEGRTGTGIGYFPEGW
ncbi:YmaF family protein [Litchfieldia alkalitelluris]|uniref:YmaF family protein n=1 Tax=Litchfieldia alkalitelluris TaxID=304268 RepID=UPI0009982AF6|nr:YmaF family protein [Litchfieldia alkalitelluris]